MIPEIISGIIMLVLLPFIILFVLAFILNYKGHTQNVVNKVEKHKKKNKLLEKEKELTKFKEEFTANNDPEHSKIAFCFLTTNDVHKNDIWKDFFSNNEDKYNIYLHSKNPINISSFFKNHIIKSLIPTKWGDVSLVRATLNMFKEALKDKDNKAFVLLSDSCIPLYDFYYIYGDLMFNGKIKNYLSTFKEKNNAVLHRYNQLRDKEFISYQKFNKVSQWMILNRETVKFLVDHDHTELYADMFAPDEHYFVNMLDRYKIEYEKRDITYVDWKNPSTNPKYRPLPKTFDVVKFNDIKKARSYGCLFFRKIAKESKINAVDLFKNYLSDVSIV